jgi:thiol-disulfide isomerase/thioredoxin
MNPFVVAGLLIVLVALATALGFVYRSVNGRVRGADGRTIIRASDIPGIDALGARATLLQFSTEVCAPCKPTRTLLGAIAGESADVQHIDVDLTHLPSVASRFNILQTPTTFILDGRGVVRARIGGAPRRADVREALDRILTLASA